MKIIVAPDSFKGSVPAIQACDAIEKGILAVLPEANIVKLPIADGGEGTVDTFIAATASKKLQVKVTDPLEGKTDAVFAVTEDKTAIIEMAAASGLMLINPEDRNPLISTSYGTGELIKAALDYGCRKIIIGLGGSATNDGGAGLVQALGFSLKDKNGEELGFGGIELSNLCAIDCTKYDKRLDECEIIAACDVTNPLCGETGASAVFGPQKGADAEMIKKLDASLLHYSKIIENQMGIKVINMPGAGAAGGLAAGLIAFCNARIASGIEMILDTIQFDEYLDSADLVITGEGRIDYQSVFGKVPVGVAKRAMAYQVPVLAVVGGIGEGAEAVFNYGIDSIISIIDKPMALKEAMDNAAYLMKNTAERTMRTLLVGMNLKRHYIKKL